VKKTAADKADVPDERSLEVLDARDNQRSWGWGNINNLGLDDLLDERCWGGNHSWTAGDEDILGLSQVGDGNVLSIELGVEVHVVLSDLGEVLLEDLSLGSGLGEVVTEDVVGILESGDGVGLGIQTDGHVVELVSCSVKLEVEIGDSGIETIGLVNQSNIGLLNLADMSLSCGEGALEIGTVGSGGVQVVGQISHGSIKVGDLIS
jgi:hypothetical protein